MELFSNPTDDQIALMGCALALLVCGGLMYVSFFVGRLRQPGTSTTHTVSIRSTTSTAESSDRKAA